MNNEILSYSSRATHEQPAPASARMILLLTKCLLIFFVLAGTGYIPQDSRRQNYPVIIKDSVDRRSRAEREWRRMLDAYGVVQTPPDLYPVTNTPRSIVGVSGGIRLLDYKPNPGDEALALREAVKVFVDRWRDLLALDPAALSLESAEDSGDTRKLTFRQSSYAYPIGGTFGHLIILIDRTGTLLQLDDRFVPQVDLPLKPSVDRELVSKKIIGRIFHYTDIAGRQQEMRVSGPNEVSVKRLVIMPLEKADSVEMHLAWEVVAGNSMSWTVYIDAVTGEELKTVQNFQT